MDRLQGHKPCRRADLQGECIGIHANVSGVQYFNALFD